MVSPITAKTLFNPDHVDKSQRKQMGQIQELVQQFMRLHWSDYRDVLMKGFSYKLVNDQVYLKTQNGKYRPMVLGSMKLTDKDWGILYKISKVTKNLMLANLRKDGFYDSASTFLPGSSGIFRLPKDLWVNRKDKIKAKAIGDDVGIKEANIRYRNQGIALSASCIMAFNLTLTVLEYLSTQVVSVVTKTSIAQVAGALGAIAASIELLRLVSWMFYTHKIKKELHVSLLDGLQTKLNMVGDLENLSQDQWNQIEVMFTSVKKAVKDEGLTRYERRVERLIQSKDNPQALKTALERYKKHLIYLDFKHLTDDLQDPKKHKELSRKFGAKFVVELQMVKDHIIKDMKGSKGVGFEKAEKLLRDADWQATKRMILYALGIICCLLTIAWCVGVPFNAAIGLFITMLVISSFVTYAGQKYFVDSSGFGILSNYHEEEKKQEFIKRQQCALTHSHLLA